MNQKNQITLAESYDPFGNTINSMGSDSSIFGYAGEQTDPSGLQYLRARYYDPATAGFISRDLWSGDANDPMSFNHWAYTADNPVNASDPSGFITEKEAETGQPDWILARLNLIYNVHIDKDWGYQLVPMGPARLVPPGISTGVLYGCEWDDGNWRNTDELQLTLNAVTDLANKLGGPEKFKAAMNQVHALRLPWGTSSFANPYSPGEVGLTDGLFNGGDVYAKFFIVHELGHVWDYRSGHQLSFNLMKAVHSWVCISNSGIGPTNVCYWNPSAAIEDPPDTLKHCELDPSDPDCLRNPPYSSTYGSLPLGLGYVVEGPGWEDWAQSLAFYVYGKALYTNSIGLGANSIRRKYIEEQIAKLH